MVRSKNEKLLSADIDCHIVDKFLGQAAERGFTKKRVLAAAAKLWTELPLEVQARLLDKSTSADSFTELLRKIVDEQIKKAVASGDRKKTN
jgi:hypothetical protein